MTWTPYAAPPQPVSLYLRLAFLSLIAIFGVYGVAHARALNRQFEATRAGTDQNALGDFPKQIGNYTLVRSWNRRSCNSGGCRRRMTTPTAPRWPT